MKKSDRFEKIEDYKKSASKTAQKVAFNRKMNAILQYYGFHDKFTGVDYPVEFEYYENEEKLNTWYLENCKCPISLLARLIDLHHNFNQDMTIQGIIAKEIGKTTESSFTRFGDKNWLDKKIKRNYISEDGQGLDIMAMEMSNQGIEISENDIVEFITSHPDGPKTYQYNLFIDDISKAFHSLVGFYPDYSFAVRMVKEVVKVEVYQDGGECPF